MAEPLHRVDLEACNGDGICVSLGLGTTTIGLIPPVVDRSQELRARYGIPKPNRVLTSLILGHPRYRYKRSIRRDLAGVRVM